MALVHAGDGGRRVRWLVLAGLVLATAGLLPRPLAAEAEAAPVPQARPYSPELPISVCTLRGNDSSDDAATWRSRLQAAASGAWLNQTSDCAARDRLPVRHGAPSVPYPVLLGERDRTEAHALGLASCHDARRFNTVFDLGCVAVWAEAYYHRLMDCLEPSLDLYELADAALASDPNGTAVFMSQSLEPYAQLLLGAHHRPLNKWVYAQRREPQTPKARPVPPCAVIGEHTRVVYSQRPAWRLDLEKASGAGPGNRTRAFRLREWAHRAAGLPVPAADPPSTLVLVQRYNTRKIANLADVAATLASALPSLHIAVYHGNLTAADTVRLFAAARVVVAFHGAATVNTLFCQPGTVLVELTLFTNTTDQNVRLWRANSAPVLSHGDLRYIPFALRVADAVTDHNDSTVRALLLSTDADHALKDHQQWHVPIADLTNIVAAIRATLGPPA